MKSSESSLGFSQIRIPNELSSKLALIVPKHLSLTKFIIQVLEEKIAEPNNQSRKVKLTDQVLKALFDLQYIMLFDTKRSNIEAAENAFIVAYEELKKYEQEKN